MLAVKIILAVFIAALPGIGDVFIFANVLRPVVVS